jgi:hypothetical protein
MTKLTVFIFPGFRPTASSHCLAVPHSEKDGSVLTKIEADAEWPKPGTRHKEEEQEKNPGDGMDRTWIEI